MEKNCIQEYLGSLLFFFLKQVHILHPIYPTIVEKYFEKDFAGSWLKDTEKEWITCSEGENTESKDTKNLTEKKFIHNKFPINPYCFQ